VLGFLRISKHKIVALKQKQSDDTKKSLKLTTYCVRKPRQSGILKLHQNNNECTLDRDNSQTITK